MRPGRDVVMAPLLDDDAGLRQRVEHLTIEQLVAHSGVEALNVAIFPRRAGFNIGRPGTDRADPISYFPGNELRPVVGTNVFRRTTQDEQVGQGIDDIRGVKLACKADHQRLLCKLIDDVEDAVSASVMRAVLHEVIGPHMIRPFRSQTDT